MHHHKDAGVAAHVFMPAATSHKALWQFTKCSNQRSATLRFHISLHIFKTYTMTPTVKTPRHLKDIMVNLSRLRCCMQNMLSPTILTTIRFHHQINATHSLLQQSAIHCSPTRVPRTHFVVVLRETAVVHPGVSQLAALTQERIRSKIANT